MWFGNYYYILDTQTALKTLDASFNQLEVLPPLGELRKVERIMFQSNNLKGFPDISGCSALTVLHLDNNNIPVCVNALIYTRNDRDW